MVDAHSEELRRVPPVDATALLSGRQPANEKLDGRHVARPTVRLLEAGRRRAEKNGPFCRSRGRVSSAGA